MIRRYPVVTKQKRTFAQRHPISKHAFIGPTEISAVWAYNPMQRVESMDKQIHHYKTVNDKLTHEIAQLKRFKFAKRSEQLNPDQASLLDDLIAYPLC